MTNTITKIVERFKAREEIPEKRGYERVRGFASTPETLPTVNGRGHHIVFDMGGVLSPDFIPSSESYRRRAR